MDEGAVRHVREARNSPRFDAALLGRCLLLVNSGVVLMCLKMILFDSTHGNPYGVGIFGIVGIYYFSIVGYPTSVVCLLGKPKPMWVKVALFLNAPFFLLQSLLLTVTLVLMVAEGMGLKPA